MTVTNAGHAGGYRTDIDGLRAISVLAVLAFHAGAPLLPGGFIGVDVFFVLSGYLITGLLLTEYERNGTISLAGFWARRIRRLAPALLFVLAVLLISSTFLLHRVSGETGALARATIATLLLNANQFFLGEAGNYFGQAAETNPLLHMWSLSVEEQFYLLWPLVFLILAWCTRRARLPGVLAGVIAVALLASLAVSTLWSVNETTRGFYLMPSRAWELLAGALLAVFLGSKTVGCSRWQGALLGLSGLVLIVGSAALLTGQTFFPGPLAALPVVGAVLLVIAGAASPANGVSRAVGSRILAYVGKISYPLYLWHWPILVISRSQRLYEHAVWHDVQAVCLSVVPAVFTYEIVERRAWNVIKTFKPRTTIVYGLAGNSAVIGIALLLGAWARFGWGYSEKEQFLAASRNDLPNLNCMFSSAYPHGAPFDACFPVSEMPSILLWGDSHANHWRPALESAARGLGINLAILTMNECRPLPGPVGQEHCADFNDNVIRNIPSWRKSRHLSGIVVSGRWPEGTGTTVPSIVDSAHERPGEFFDRRASSAEEALSYLETSLGGVVHLARDQGLRILIILPSPVQRFLAAHCLATRNEDACYVSLDEMRAYASPAERVMLKVADENANVRTIDPDEFMCGRGRCPDVIDGMIAYTDDDHVSRTFSQASASRFSNDLAWLVGRNSSTTDPSVH
jgi:peptidoglycan/LPS O-acetylase OafA/YrhL